jgi:large subunit ribosomal protein L7/L12
MGHAEEMKVFSPSRVELYCHEDVVSLTEDELSTITDNIVDIGKKYNYKITTTGNSPFANFFSKKSEEKELPLSGNEEPYNHLRNFLWAPDEVEVFPAGSLRDLYLRLCVEMILSVGGPWMYEGAKPDEFLYEKLDELKLLLDTEAKDGFAGIIDSEMKSALTNGVLQKSLEQMEKQFTSLNKALDKIKIESVDDTLEDMSLEELAASIGAEITCPTADVSSAEDQEVVDDDSLHDVIVNKVGPRSLWVAKTINVLNRKNLEDILEGLETPPLTCLQKVSLPEAVRAKSALEKVGAEITLKQVKAANRSALSDTKKPTTQKNSNGDKKTSEASEATYNKLANAHSVLASVLANNAQQKAGISPKISISEQKTPNSNSADMYAITMTSPGAKVMSVGRCLVRLTGKDLEDLLESMEEMPMVIAEKATSEQMEQFKSELEPLGVTLDIKELEHNPLVTVSCKLLLTGTGPKIMKVARILVPKTGLELESVLEKFEELPFVIASEMKMEDAEELKNQLEELGASVNLEKEEIHLNPITYSVVLTDTGSKIMKLGRLVVTLTGKELETVLEAFENIPYIVKEGATPEEAEQFKARLEELGAKVEINENKNLDSKNVTKTEAKDIIQNTGNETVVLSQNAPIKSEKTPQKRGDKVKSEKSLQKQGNKVKSEKIPQKQGNNPSPKLPRPTSSSPIAVEKQFSMNEPSHSTKTSSPKAVKKEPIEKDASQTIDTDLIWEKIESVLSSIHDDNVFVRSNLNYKKLGNAIQKYASGAQNEAVLLQVDDTVFGAADEGLIVTNKAVYWRHTFIDPIRTLLNRRIKNIELQEGNIFYCDRQKIGEIILPDKKTTNPKILELLRLVAKLNP